MQQVLILNLYDTINMATALDYLSKATWTAKVEINRPNLFDFSQKSTATPNAMSFISNIPKAQTFTQPTQPTQNTPPKYLTKIKVKEIIDNRPAWVQPVDIFKQLETTGYTMEWYNDIVQQPEQWLVQNFNQWVWNIIWWATSQLPNIVSNIGWFFIGKPVDYLLEKAWINAPSLEEQLKKDWLESKQAFQQKLWVNPDDFTTQIWEFGWEVWSLFIPWWQSKLISKFPQAADKIKKLSTTLNTLSTKAPKTYALLKSWFSL